MAKKISQLTQATEVKSDDVTVIVQDGETKKLPLNMMVTKQDIENKKIAGLAKLDEIEATYENDTYTPTITVKNKSSVKTGEGDEVDYSANVMDGHAKSAILSGQTLVNLLNKLTVNVEAEQTEQWRSTAYATGTVKSGKYILLYNVKETSKTIRNTPRIRLAGDKYLYHGYDDFNTTTGIKKWIFTANTDLLGFSYWVSGNTGKVVVEDFILLEYQDGMENWDIPYFTGMQSVKLPVLTTSNEDGTKTNILSTPEDVTLRGIGEVKDELDCLTGEKVERIGEVVYDGSDDENWDVAYINVDGLIGIATNIPSDMKYLGANRIDGFINDRLKQAVSENMSIYSGYGGWRMFAIYMDSSTFDSAQKIKQWLSQNPITVQYELDTESIKTVDLMPSGTHPSTTPYCWKNGHIQLSSSGLLPNLEYSVVTSRAGQINQNATMIVKNDKRIFDLEILLAGGLVNTTYQALILQNQVETGLSKVSLSSEKEPDYLLYHMIMKLIEEKAYKLDDLTEKVSVFYLYEKLSDEQFETIYSELYPFVEDEIIEEPVVEELPEVVEDEVIM